MQQTESAIGFVRRSMFLSGAVLRFTLRRMPIHPQMQGFLDLLIASQLPPYEESTVQGARDRMEAVAMLERPAEPVAEVRDLSVPSAQGDIPLRLYHPQPGQIVSALLYFHGGGWVVGSIASHDRLCRAIANAAGCAVISVGYRLAPEHKFPAAVLDADAAFQYVTAHAAELGIDAQHVAVGGDSAGGNLAAVVALHAKAAGGVQPKAQLLLYPALGGPEATSSKEQFANGYLLTAGAMKWFSSHYVRTKQDLFDPDVAPSLAADHRNLPSTYILTAEFDPLRDEGEAYAELLYRAKVPVTLRRWDGMIHGFLQLTAMVPVARLAIDELASWLRTTLLRVAVPKAAASDRTAQ